MDRDVRTRLKWVTLFNQLGHAGIVCHRCGISRPTLRKWVGRYREHGMRGLQSQSRRPHRSPARKTTAQIERWIVELRGRKLGARRLQAELLRLHNCRLALATIQKVLNRQRAAPLTRRRRKKQYKRYARPIPGERVQMDVCKIRPACYQYTAIDDCTRYKVVAVFSRRTAANTLTFLDQVLEEMPFPIARIQTDRGREFFAAKVQKHLMTLGIKFRPIKPGSPHLNGKVERAQRTDLDEFYDTIDVDVEDFELRLAEWQHHYNWHRPHGSLNGKTPMERYFEVADRTPFWDEVLENYDPRREHIQESNYQRELQLRELKRSV